MHPCQHLQTEKKKAKGRRARREASPEDWMENVSWCVSAPKQKLCCGLRWHLQPSIREETCRSTHATCPRSAQHAAFPRIPCLRTLGLLVVACSLVYTAGRGSRKRVAYVMLFLSLTFSPFCLLFYHRKESNRCNFWRRGKKKKVVRGNFFLPVDPSVSQHSTCCKNRHVSFTVISTLRCVTDMNINGGRNMK